MQNNQQKLDEFQTRMSNWTASQGLLFQLRHGGSVQGVRPTLIGWVTRMGLRILLLVLVCSLAGYFYLLRRTSSEQFNGELAIALQEFVSAETMELGPFSKKDGYLELSSLDIVGGEDSFFDEAYLRNAKTRMSLLARIRYPRAAISFPPWKMAVTNWQGEEIIIEDLDITVKSGADEADGAKIYDSIFSTGEKFSFERVQVLNASFDWGYSEVTAGSIRNSRLNAQRKGDGWSVTITGGSFSQNWLQDLEIEKLECVLTGKGLEITEGRFKRAGGSLALTGKVTGPVTNPQVSASGTMQGIPFDSYLEAEVQPFVRGRLSGRFTLGGSPYSSSGVTMAAEIVLGPDDEVVISDEIRLLDAVSLVDRYRSYKNVRFRAGSFKLETGKRVAVFTDIDLEAKDHMKLEGEFISRPPSRKEIDAAIYFDQHGDAAPSPAENSGEDDEAEEGAASLPFNLVDAAKAAREESDSDERIKTIFESEVFGLEVRRREEEARARYRRVPFIQGVVRMGLHAKAFEANRSRRLSEMYPIDEVSGLRWLEVKLDQGLSSIGIETSEKILRHVKD